MQRKEKQRSRKLFEPSGVCGGGVCVGCVWGGKGVFVWEGGKEGGEGVCTCVWGGGRGVGCGGVGCGVVWVWVGWGGVGWGGVGVGWGGGGGAG